MPILRNSLSLVLALLLNAQAYGQFVIEDEGVGMTAQEVEFIVSHWTHQMQESAALDVGDRFELLNMAMANKKIALEARKFSPEKEPQVYWSNQLIVRNAERKFVVDDYMGNLKVPDMSELAQERYITNPDKYAALPEARKVSHILFRCKRPECDRDERKKQVAQVLAQLEAGADFEALVLEYSEDTGTKKTGGLFDRWLQADTKGVEPYFLQAVLSMNEVGGYSGLVDTSFGIHILRLDDFREKSYLPYDQVKQVIVDDLRHEYKILAAKEYDARFRLTDRAYIDKAAMEKIFSKYQPAETSADE